MRLTRITGLPVVDTHLARQAGIVADVLMDLHAGRLAVLNVRHADGWILQRIPAEYVYRVGPRSVLVADTAAVDLGPPRRDQPYFPSAALVGLQVLTDGGDRVGNIADVELDDKTLAVTAYVLRDAHGPWRRRKRIQPDEVVTVSPELMLVKAR